MAILDVSAIVSHLTNEHQESSPQLYHVIEYPVQKALDFGAPIETLVLIVRKRLPPLARAMHFRSNA